MRASLIYSAVAILTVLNAACGEKGTLRPSHGLKGSAGSAGSAEPGSDDTPNAGGFEQAPSAGGAGGTAADDGTNGGEGGAPSEPESELAYGFDEDVQGWIVQYSSSGPEGDPVPPVPLNDITVEWSEDEGNPDGALRAEIPYDSASQYVGFGVSLSQDEAIDLTGRIVYADVKIVSGVGDEDDLLTNPAGAKIYAKSGATYVYANGSYNNVDTIGEWITISFDIEYPQFVDEANGVFDPSDVLELGIQFDTGSTSTSATPGVVLIDNIRY